MTQAATVEQYTWLANPGHFAASFKYVAPYVLDRRVLDLGCGGGVYLSRFRGDSVGVDASVPNLQRLREQGFLGVRADLNLALPFADESFDVVFCSHLLEHVEAPINLLRESYRLLRHQGRIIIALPVERSLARVVLRDHYFRGHPTHLYSFSFAGIRQLLQLAGFVHERTFVDLPGVRRLRAIWIMDLFQRLPLGWSRWFSSAYWTVGVKP